MNTHTEKNEFVHCAPRLSLRRKAIYALLPVAALLVGAELLLRLVGYTSPAADPFESFVFHRPVFLENDRDGQLATDPRRRRFFHAQSFTANKRAGTVRIFAFGGSATYGYKLNDPLAEAYPARLAARLSEQLGKPVEMINCGGLQYASHRLVGLLEECLAYEPDLMIVMSGNNEFLEAGHYEDLKNDPSIFKRWWYGLRLVHLIHHLATRYQSVIDVDTIDERYIVRSQEEIDQTLGHFGDNVNVMVEKCRQAGVPLILCTVATNLRDHRPFAMELSGDITPAELQQRNNESTALYKAGEIENAIGVARQLLDSEPRAATVHFMVAKSLEKLDRFDEAAEHYRLAKDTDAFPHRALTSFNHTLRRIAGQRGVTVYDAEREFSRNAPNGIPGNDLFADHCHPNSRGHELLADGLAKIAAEFLNK